jgi:hypothetical protein
MKNETSIDKRLVEVWEKMKTERVAWYDEMQQNSNRRGWVNATLGKLFSQIRAEEWARVREWARDNKKFYSDPDRPKAGTYCVRVGDLWDYLKKLDAKK